ncbi:MAG: HAMP domain-containing histidine kinase [Alloprevotella sp.]|nr:HAMP domain-containing histidine kinase [Alloprevotella sp.]
MKKSTIWFITIAMGASFLTLLYLQARYLGDVLTTRQEQLSENVARALSQTAHSLELNETHQMLLEMAGTTQQEADTVQQADSIALTVSAFEQRMAEMHGTRAAKAFVKGYGEGTRAGSEQLRRHLYRSYRHQQGLLEEEVFSLLYQHSTRPLAERLDGLEGLLTQALRENGIDDETLAYHYYVTNSVGDTVSVCPDFAGGQGGRTYRQVLFANDAARQQGILYVVFPDMKRYVFSSARFVVPAMLFTLVLLFMFVFTIYSFFRQKKLAEMKNDFINNMTHEFKTPISSISLAAQMLADPAVGKNEASVRRITGVITDETKRLRFQVEKVLQMSLFDKKGGAFNPRQTHLNRILADVASTFRLKVESSGGTIETYFNAGHDLVFGDEMHLTNVIFNLLDNAVKYKHPDRPLRIHLSSLDKGHGRIVVTVEDNGIGVKRDDLKKIFDQFYRAHTGNRHDVKGFGLGLAYVKKVVDYHHGTIHAESAGAEGTRFVVTLPTVSDE